MKIGGFQRFSLLDYPGQLAAIVFCQACNFRCPYCHNPELVLPEKYGKLIETEWLLKFLYRRRKKLSAVVVSGGEPSLQEDLIPFLKVLKAMRYKVKLDTNGSLPEVLEQAILSDVVDYFAVDIKAPLPLYNILTRSNVLPEDLLQSMKLVRESGKRYEFRTTVFSELLNWQDIQKIQDLLEPGDRYYLQECRYTNTLDDLRLGKTERVDFLRSPDCQSLIDWGKAHRVEIAVRG